MDAVRVLSTGIKKLLDKPLIKKSLIFAYNAHKNQKRCSGEDYIVHPIEVAKILSRSRVIDEEVLAAGLLHDVVEKTNVSLEQLEHEFGKNIKDLVDGVTKLAKICYRKNLHIRQLDAIKKLFFTMLRDPRIILVKLADRLHNMRTLVYMPDQKKELIAQETLEIYCPVANMLGLRDWTWELEDLSFKFLNPEEYEKISKNFGSILKNLSGCTNNIKKNLLKLTRGNIKFEIKLFKKHNYHIYRAQQNKTQEFNPIRDTSAIRIITNSVVNCYKLLGFIHSFYPPQSGAIKDYIAIPKTNGYQGLHTTIFGPEGKMLHIQIQTEKMNQQSKMSDSNGMSEEKFIKNVLKIHRCAKNPADFVHRMKSDMLGNKIFVFSSKGKIIDLPENSTCVDYAYAINPNLVNYLKEAVVNDKTTHLSTRLKTGDIVKIIIDKTQTGPAIEWLETAQTTAAQHHIANWYKSADKNSAIKHGKEKMDATLRVLLGTTLEKSKKEIKKLIKEKKSYANFDELFETIGNGIEKPCAALIKIYPEKYLLKSEAQKKFQTFAFKKLHSKPVKLVITTDDTVGMMNRVTHCISSKNVNIEENSSKTFKETKTAIIEFIIAIKSFQQLCELVTDLRQIEGVRDIYKI